MTTSITIPPNTLERIKELLTVFKLPTMASQLVQRFLEGGHHEALGTMLEVLEAESEERGHRRCDRLLKASQLPAGKTFDTLDEARLPRKVVQQLRELSSGNFLESADNVLCYPMQPRPSGMPWSSVGTPSSSLRRSVSCRTFSLPSATWSFRRHCESSTTSSSSFWTILVMSSNRATRWRCSSR